MQEGRAPAPSPPTRSAAEPLPGASSSGGRPFAPPALAGPPHECPASNQGLEGSTSSCPGRGLHVGESRTMGGVCGAGALSLAGFAGLASAASYTWTLTCGGGGEFPGAASASWEGLVGGQVIAGASGVAGCGGGGGGGRPANADGGMAPLTADTLLPCG